MTNGNNWEDSQDYLVFVASSFSFTNAEDRKFARELLRKHNRGISWTPEELSRIKAILNERKKQVNTWERDSVRSTQSDTSYREFEA